MGVFGDAHWYTKSKSSDCVLFNVGSDALLCNLGYDRANDSIDANTWETETSLIKQIKLNLLFDIKGIQNK